MRHEIIEIDDRGVRYWYRNGKRHREDGPAIEYPGGTCEWWYRNNELHREDGPAVKYANGYCAWFQNGLAHRLNGPAVKYVDGSRAWYLNGVEYTEEEYKIEMRLRHCGLSTNVPYEWKKLNV